MFRIINNIDDSSLLSVDARCVVGSSGNYSFVPVNNQCFSFTNTSTIFIKINVNNASPRLIFKDDFIVFSTASAPFPQGTAIKLYKLNTDIHQFGNSANTLMSYLTPTLDYLIDEVVVEDNSTNSVELDFSEYLDIEFPNITSGFEVFFAITTSYSPGFTLPIRFFPTFRSIRLSGFNFRGLNLFNEYQEYSCSKYDTGYLNLKTGDLTQVFNLFTSRGKKAPISTVFAYNYQNDVKYFLFKVKFDFEYEITKNTENNTYLFKASSAYEMLFKNIDRQDSDIESILTYYGILHYDLYPNALLYYCGENASYIYVDVNENYIYLFNKNDIQMVFEKANNEYRLIKCGGLTENYVEYSYVQGLSENKVNSITSTDGDIVNFIYTNSGVLSQIIFVNEKRTIGFAETNDGYDISLYFVDDSLNLILINKLSLSFTSDKLSSIIEYDNSNNQMQKLTYFYSGSKISHVYTYKTNTTTISHKSYQYSGSYTKITNISNDSVYYYFDKYGRTRLIVDSKGDILANNYHDITNGQVNNLSESRKPLNFSRNIVENHSFEHYDNYGNVVSWLKLGTSTKYELSSDSVFGSRSLYIETNSSQTVTLTQTLVNIPAGDYHFSIFAKKNSSANVAVTLSITGTPSIDFTNLSENWDKYSSCDISITSPIISAVLTITINPNSKVYFDELNFSSREQNIRYSLIKNGYLEKINAGTNLPQDITIVNDNDNSSIISLPVIDNHLSFLGNNILEINRMLPLFSVNRFLKKTITSTNAISGYKGENINLFVALKCYATNSDILKVALTFNYKNISNLTYEFDFEKNASDFQLLSRSIVTEDDYNYFYIQILYDGFHALDLYAIEAYRDSNSVFIDYDRRGGVALFANGSGATYSLIKNANGQAQALKNVEGEYLQLSYDNDGYLIEVDNLNGNKIEYQYDTNKNANQLSLVYNNNIDIISTQYVYFQNSTLWKVIENNVIVSEYIYDYLYRPVTIIYPDGGYQSLVYDNLGNLQSIEAFDNNNTSIGKNEVSFDYQLEVKTSLSGSNINNFTFTYDSYGRNLLFSCATLSHACTYTYNSYSITCGRGLPSTKHYTYANKKYFFNYDGDNRLISVNYGSDNDNSTILSYEYNEHNQIAVINDLDNENKKFYSYDLKGRTLKYTTYMFSTKYKYDKLDNIQEKIYQIGQFKKMITNDYYYENNVNTKEAFIELLKASGDEVLFAPNNGFGESGAVYSCNNCKLENDSSLGFKVFRFYDEDDDISYDLETLNQSRNSGQNNGKYFNLSEWKSGFKNCKTIYLFVKYDGTLGQNKTIDLVKLYSQNNDSFISLKIDDQNKVWLYSNQFSVLAFPNSSLLTNAWNFIAITIYDNVNETACAYVTLNNSISTHYLLYIFASDLTHAVFYQNEAANVNSAYDQTEPYPVPLDLHFSVPLIGFSNKLIDSLLLSQLIDGFNSTFFTNNNTKTNSTSIFDDTFFGNLSCDFIPLNGSFDTKNGMKPVNKSVSNFSVNPSENELFIYDSLLKKRVFNRLSSVFLNPLTYYFSCIDKGTVSLWFNLNTTSSYTKRYIFLIHDNQNSLGVLVNSDTLHLDVNGTLIDLGVYCNTNIWNHLYFAFGANVTSGVEIRINGTVIQLSNPIVPPSFSNAFITLASKNVADMNNDYSCLDGKVDSVLLFADYAPYYSYWVDYCRPTAFVSSYDHFDRLSSKEILTSSFTYFRNEYSYNRFRPISETLFTKNNGTPLESFTYSYDNKGNVLRIASGNQPLDKFVYDKLNRLVGHIHGRNEYTEFFSYDNNGNLTHYIKEVGGVRSLDYNYTYNHGIGSISVKQNNTTIFAASINNPYPSIVTINGSQKTFTWKGKRLTKIGNNITYTYNEEGIRTRKVTPNEDTSYILEDKKIVKMIRIVTNNPYPFIFDFNYDTNGQLAGLVYNNKQYFYVRNVLGDILGIVNSNGSYVVKYSYTAFGVPTIDVLGSGDDASVALHNPYMFKGYYYDTETGFYYLNTRYYYPVIARFISGDDSSHLDETKFNGLNIYSYCNNNPVMFADPDGNEFLTVLAFVLFGVVLSITYVFMKDLDEHSKTNNWDHFNPNEYWIAAISGAISGLTSGLFPSSMIATFFAAGLATGTQMGLEHIFGVDDYLPQDYIDNIGRSMIFSLFIQKARYAAIGSTYNDFADTLVDEIINWFFEDFMDFYRRIKEAF